MPATIKQLKVSYALPYIDSFASEQHAICSRWPYTSYLQQVLLRRNAKTCVSLASAAS